jgi:hypothetical protein
MAIEMRSLRCLLTPPFHHDWKLADSVNEEGPSSSVDSAGWADPIMSEFREYELRCARCGKETWSRDASSDPAAARGLAHTMSPWVPRKK